MRKPKVKPRDTEAMRAAAKTLAYRIAEASGIDPDTVRHMRDNQYDEPCFVVTEDENRAVVVYDNEPQVKQSILNFPGRFVAMEQQA